MIVIIPVNIIDQICRRWGFFIQIGICSAGVGNIQLISVFVYIMNDSLIAFIRKACILQINRNSPVTGDIGTGCRGDQCITIIIGCSPGVISGSGKQHSGNFLLFPAYNNVCLFIGSSIYILRNVIRWNNDLIIIWITGYACNICITGNTRRPCDWVSITVYIIECDLSSCAVPVSQPQIGRVVCRVAPCDHERWKTGNSKYCLGSSACIHHILRLCNCLDFGRSVVFTQMLDFYRVLDLFQIFHAGQTLDLDIYLHWCCRFNLFSARGYDWNIHCCKTEIVSIHLFALRLLVGKNGF